MGLPPGTKLGQYEIIAPLGAGGKGEVYRARDTQPGREVAIKVLPASFSRDPDRMRRFEQEARAAAALNHPNVLAVYQFGNHDGSPYLVSELLEGSSLREQLMRAPLRCARPWILQCKPRVDWPPHTIKESSTAISSPRMPRQQILCLLYWRPRPD